MIFVDPRPFPLWRMTPVDRVILKFGSIRAVAEAVGVDRSAISQWKGTGYVPTKRQRELLRAAHAKGIALEPADFFDIEGGAAPPEPMPTAKPEGQAA